jgi:hypothetical protein
MEVSCRVVSIKQPGDKYEDQFKPKDKRNDTNFLATVPQQTMLNSIAAIWTALAILFQAAASSPLIESWIRR